MKNQNKYVRLQIKAWLITIITPFLIFGLMLIFLYPGIVSGPSMEPNYYGGDRFFIINDFLISQYQYGDVVCVNIEDRTLIKRIIGLPGDRIEIKNGSVFRNGELVDESEYLPYDTKTICDYEHPEVFEVGDNEYFVLGDNRKVSYDSRGFGNVSSIRGKIWFFYRRSWFE